MPYELRPHTADVAVAASGPTLAAVFAATAEGLAAASCDDRSEAGEGLAVSVEAESREALLFEYLDELIYVRDVESVLPVDHAVDVHETEGTWALSGSARGIPLSEIDAREVKAVTYADMRLEETADGWEAYVVFDV
ncbi:archease [Halovivax cerinus]|uniref:Archease n=1 Tax=Halovivax cerinus TaxID=1487865 RepID=A0ABD5NN58_9EURY|nr:archease [Halovivax cerinus]